MVFKGRGRLIEKRSFEIENFVSNFVLSKLSYFWRSFECRSYEINAIFERTLYDQSTSTYPKQVNWSKDVLSNSLLTEPNLTTPNLTPNLT